MGVMTARMIERRRWPVHPAHGCHRYCMASRLQREIRRAAAFIAAQVLANRNAELRKRGEARVEACRNQGAGIHSAGAISSDRYF